MKFEIMPNVGVGVLQYGMKRPRVRQSIGLPFRTFHKASENVESEQYLGIGLVAYYDEHDGLEALEFARPAQPTLVGLDLLALDLIQARNLIRAAGGPMHDYAEGPISKVLGIGVWAPDYRESAQAALESVIAFGPGYYEKYPDGP